MNISKNNAILAVLATILLFLFALNCGIIVGKNASDEEWRKRTQEAGFNLVTRYDQITGQPRLVLIPVNKSEIK